MEKSKNRKRDRKQNTALPDILIYHKKKYIVGYSLLLFLGILVLAMGITLYISVSVGGEDPVKVLKEMLVPRNIVYLLPGFAILEIPVLLICGVLRIGERRFLRVYQGIPEEAKQKLFRLRARSLFLRGLGFYEADGYILFNDRCVFGTPQIVRTEDIVWGYLGRSDFQFSDMERNVVSPGVQFFSLCFYTKDGRRHRIFANVSYSEVAAWFTARCPEAILGYGKEQKRQAEEIFRAEAERTAFLSGEERDSWLVRKKRTLLAAVGGSFLTVIVLAAGFGGWRYINSDEYLYRKNMRQADKWYAEGEVSRAYQAYSAAGDYRPGDEEVQKGRLLSSLGMAKTDGYLDSIIRDYENLFSCQELFTDETDISGWYFECAEYYLLYEDPVGAVDLLERGIETFEDPETVVGGEFTGEAEGLMSKGQRERKKEKGEREEKAEEGEREEGKEEKEEGEREEKKEGEEEEEGEREKEEKQDGDGGSGRRESILGRMRSKKEDILAHCEVEAVTEYLYGDKMHYTEFDEAGREVLNVHYYSGPQNSGSKRSIWIYKTYDNAGNLILEETWHQEEGETEKEKQSEERFVYDGDGNKLHEERYDLERGKITHEVNCEYDVEGNRTYFQDIYNGEVFLEQECCVLSGLMRIDREYNGDYRDEEDRYSYTEKRWDEEGRLREEAYYPADYTPQEIEDGKAKAWSRYYYTYDGRGNCTVLSCQYEEGGEPVTIYKREYDDRNNLVKENYYYRNGLPDADYRETTVWYYDDRNLLIKKAWNEGDIRNEEGEEYEDTYPCVAEDHLVFEELYTCEAMDHLFFEEIYTYDESENLIRVDYLSGGQPDYSVIKEYDVFGSQTKEYRVEGKAGGISEDVQPDKSWEYRYRYEKQGENWRK